MHAPNCLRQMGSVTLHGKKDQTVNISNLELGTITLDGSDVMNFVVSGSTFVKPSATHTPLKIKLKNYINVIIFIISIIYSEYEESDTSYRAMSTISNILRNISRRSEMLKEKQNR